jgi:acyl-CoA-binding protein
MLCSSRATKTPHSRRPLRLAPSTSRYVSILQRTRHHGGGGGGWFVRSQGKAKYNKWAEYKDLSAADAQKKYVQLVKDLAAKYN